MDFEELLRKYIKYIKCAEGTDYIDPHDYRSGCLSEVQFTEEEWVELKRLAKAGQ